MHLMQGFKSYVYKIFIDEQHLRCVLCKKRINLWSIWLEFAGAKSSVFNFFLWAFVELLWIKRLKSFVEIFDSCEEIGVLLFYKVACSISRNNNSNELENCNDTAERHSLLKVWSGKSVKKLQKFSVVFFSKIQLVW